MNLTPFQLLGFSPKPPYIVHGDRDVFVPVPIAVEIYASIPVAQLWIVPGGDHVPIFDHNARAFEQATLRFLADPVP